MPRVDTEAARPSLATPSAACVSHRRRDLRRVPAAVSIVSRSSPAKAALFIYLNKTCYNGIWRVNRQGLFNVPYGHKDGIAFPALDDLRKTSLLLNNASLKCGDFEKTLATARSGDFVYLDPPYPPLNGTAYFCHYTKERFSVEDHLRVARVFRQLTDRGVGSLLSYADVPLVRQLYSGQTMLEIQTKRYLASHGHRYAARDA